MITSVSPTEISPSTMLFIIPVDNIVYLTINATAPGAAKVDITVKGKLGNKRIETYTFNNKLYKSMEINYWPLRDVVYP